MVNILVTGATQGIGKAIAEELSDVGTIFASGRNVQLLQKYKNYCVCDLATDVETLESYIEAKKIDILINNAGEYIYGSIDKMTDDQIREIFEVNLLAPVKLIAKASVNKKKKKWGRIINIGSISGIMGEANASLYSSTKSGLVGLTRALALELAEYNITVNTVNPGWVDTELGMTSAELSEFFHDEIIETIPQRRFVQPIEIAKLVKYLVSDDAKGITGQSINLCAGLSVGI